MWRAPLDLTVAVNHGLNDTGHLIDLSGTTWAFAHGGSAYYDIHTGAPSGIQRLTLGSGDYSKFPIVGSVLHILSAEPDVKGWPAKLGSIETLSIKKGNPTGEERFWIAGITLPESEAGQKLMTALMQEVFNWEVTAPTRTEPAWVYSNPDCGQFLRLVPPTTTPSSTGAPSVLLKFGIRAEAAAGIEELAVSIFNRSRVQGTAGHIGKREDLYLTLQEADYGIVLYRMQSEQFPPS